MITLYNTNGDFCLCNPDQVDAMKSIGYTLEKNPIKKNIEVPKVIVETPETTEIETKIKKKKDIIL